jgi:cell division protein FtsL
LPQPVPRAVPRSLPRSLADRRLIDRLIRGRAWIPVLGILLAGIVAMRVEVLKLNVSVGRSVALASQLQSENQILRASVASRSADARIEALAEKLGMSMPGPLDVHFVQASGGRNLAAAAAGITQPDPETFESELQSEVAANADSISAVAPPTVTTPELTTTPAG